jgi:hypothetical protein
MPARWLSVERLGHGQLSHLRSTKRQWVADLLRRACFCIDRTPVINWFFGSIAMLWLPVVVGLAISLLLHLQVDYPAICWIATPLLALQLVAGFVTFGAKEHRRFEVGIFEVNALMHFLDWMHKQVFSGNQKTRITIMVPVRQRRGRERVLRTFLRPSAFCPIRSRTELVIDGNQNRMEGVAGRCFCEGDGEPVALDPGISDQEYAALSFLSPEKVAGLTRKGRYYLAFRLENRSGEPLGVLIVDHAELPQIMDGSPKSATRAENRVKLFVDWIALRLRAVPATIRSRA